MMRVTKLLFGVAIAVAALTLTAGPASAWFKDLRITPTEPGHCEGSTSGECGETLTETVFNVGTTARYICPTGGFHVTLWQIEKKGPQERATEGAHQLITASCEEGEAILKTGEGELKIKASLEKCSGQIEQEKGQFNNIKGKIETECIIKIGAGLCVMKAPVAPSNEGLGNAELSNGEDAKHGKYLLIKAEVGGITVKSSSVKLCGFKETKEGSFKGDLDLFGQSAI